MNDPVSSEAGAPAGGPAGAPADETTRDPRLRSRYRRIMLFAVSMMVEEIWFEVVLVRFGLAGSVRRTRASRLARVASRFRVLAIDLGGLMIKVGQFLSARLDVLPREITAELAQLQDEVAPASAVEVRAMAETELGMTLAEAFEAFSPEPVAAASLGQVHKARLRPEDAEAVGFTDVMVKVQRPGIDKVVDIDLRALRRVGGWLSRIRSISRFADIPALIDEFARTSAFELDYLHEAQNADRFRTDFEGDPRVGVPQIVWERTTQRVLTLEDVSAIKVTDLEALRAAGIDPHDVAVDVAGVMFDQFFVDGFFHADPHPGNLFVTPLVAARADPPGRAWQLTFVDFGMMGEIPDGLREGLRDLLIAAGMHDGRRIVAAMLSVGIVVPGSDTRELERAMSQMFEKFGGISPARMQQMDAHELAQFAERFEEVMRTTPFQMPEDFLLIIRSISLMSGLCSALDPEFDAWAAVEPYASQLLRESAGGVTRRLLDEGRTTLAAAARLPTRLDHFIDQAERGNLSVETPEIDRMLRRLERLVRRLLAAVVFAGLFVSGAILWGPSRTLAIWLMIASVPALLVAVFTRRTRRVLR